MKDSYKRTVEINGKFIKVHDCPLCSDTGKVRDKHTRQLRKCAVCNGNGWVKISN